MAEKVSNKKLLWLILSILFTIVLCYSFVVLYFYYISPYNIAVKTVLWPFSSSQSIGKMYQDAVVEIQFVENDDINFQDQNTKSVLGVNVDKNGYVLAPFNLIDSAVDSDYKIFSNDGTVYKGVLIFSEKNYNLAILKCERLAEKDKPIKMPYVKLTNKKPDSALIGVDLDDVYIADLVEKNVVDCKVGEFDSRYAVEYVLQDCFSIDVSEKALSDLAVFNKNGALLGFSFGGVNLDDKYVVMQTSSAKLFLQKVISAHKNKKDFSNDFASAIFAMDDVELGYHFLASNKNENEDNKQFYYFDKTWQTYSEKLRDYHQQLDVCGVYLVKDFEYNDEVLLQADSVISKIIYNNLNYNISKKKTLIDLCYHLKAGDKVQICYYDDLSLPLKKITINV